MTHRQRIEAVLTGERPDRIPWAPRLNLWYRAHLAQGTLPAQWREKSLADILRELDVGVTDRYQPYRVEYEGIRIEQLEQGDERLRVYHLPSGELRERFHLVATESGLPPEAIRTEFLIKGEDDYRPAMELVESMRFLPAMEGYADYLALLGENGVPMVSSPQYDPMYCILHDYIGLGSAYYELADNSGEVEALYELLWQRLRGLHDVFVRSGIRIVVHGSHYDSMITPPPLFRKYMIGYLSELSQRLAQAGEILAVHADADSSALLNEYEQAGVSMVDCFCTMPMSPLTLEEAVDYWGDRMIIYGGIPSTLLCPMCCPDSEFLEYTDKLFDLLRRKRPRIILGVADNVMPQADIERVRLISERVAAFRT